MSRNSRILTIGRIPFAAGRIMRHSDPAYIAAKARNAEMRRGFFVMLAILFVECVGIYASVKINLHPQPNHAVRGDATTRTATTQP